MPRVLFYVQHLLGTGHLNRAALLADAMLGSGMDVHLVSGGARAPEVTGEAKVVQLPVLSARDQTFTRLVDEAGAPVDDAFRTRRSEMLRQVFHRLAPDVVVIESFPFGRRKLRFELLPLLADVQAARPRPLVVCSVRDIVQARSADRLAETVSTLGAWFDAVLVHADPAFVRFEESFALADQIRDMIHYTGYVAPASPPPAAHPGSGILVSSGGGAVGGRLLQTTLDARRMSRHRDANWRILLGPNLPRPLAGALLSRARANLVVEPNRPDFPALVRDCRVSVSQAGYNTVMDLLNTRARCVLVPFEGDGETEQPLRSERLRRAGLATVVPERDLTPRTLAAAIDRAASAPRPGFHGLNMAGAAATARFIDDAWRQRARDSAQ